MPKIDFSTIEDAKSFQPIPDGVYITEVNSIEVTTTSRGDEMWRVRLKVLDGPHAGRYLFDNLVFSSNAIKRVKLVCSRLGVDTSGEIDLTPKLLRGRQAVVTVQIEEYVDDEGKARSRNHIPFDGYESISATGSERQPGGDDDAEDDDPL